ncbi:MAG: glycosyltransferase family 4 protein [Brevinematales bacterium]|nr:glycosyltransferase family 4 protein [Brevinematales bacterium]
MAKHILLLSPTFPPDVGGVETHMSDLVRAFVKYPAYRVTVSTYKPIVTRGLTTYSKKEVVGNVTIYRHWWFGNLFHILERLPFLQFLYLVPYLFFRTLFLCLFKVQEPDVIYAHGLSSALVAKWLKYIFTKARIVVATHAIYPMSSQSLTAKFTTWILHSADVILCLSEGSRIQLRHIGLSEKVLHRFHCWIQLENFPMRKKEEAKEFFKLSGSQFVVLFVGRLISIKGFKLLWEVAKEMQSERDMLFWFVGTGPEEDFLLNHPLPNVTFWGKRENKELFQFYNAADVFCIPSMYEEGFGRVILEALACGTPVIGSKKGGIPEVVTPDVGMVIEPTKENFIHALLMLKNDKNLFRRLQQNARPYIERYYSEKNFEEILSHLDPEYTR